MNAKTAKLLNRYATEVGANYKQVRRDWQSLNHKERAKTRKHMKTVLSRIGKSEAAGE